MWQRLLQGRDSKGGENKKTQTSKPSDSDIEANAINTSKREKTDQSFEEESTKKQNNNTTRNRDNCGEGSNKLYTGDVEM